MAELRSTTTEDSFHYASGFQEERVLGQGKFEPAVLFTAPYCSQIVLKFICGKNIIGSDDEESFSEKIRELIGNVHHPNVVAYLDYMLHNERKQLGIKMEYMTYGSLHNLMERGVDIPWSVTESILSDVTSGMAYLHAEMRGKPKILHENLHLNNVLLTGDFKAKVSDYGLKMVYALTRNHAQNRQSFEDYKFRAPERMRDITEPNTKATDVYSFGVIVYAVLKRSTDPFSPMKEEELKRTLEKGQSVVDPDRLCQDRPDVLVDVLIKATEFKPEHRTDFEGLQHLLTNIDEEELLRDVEVLKKDLLDHPFRPPSPTPEVPSDVPSLMQVSNHASPGTAGCSDNISSLSWRCQSSEQPTDEIDGADCQAQNEDRKKHTYDRTTSQISTSSRRSQFTNSSSTSGESVHFPPRDGPGDVGEDEAEAQDTSGQGSSQASSRVLSPHSDVNGVGDLANAMRSLGIEPHPSSLNQGIQSETPSTQQNGSLPGRVLHGVQNGTASIPNLPNFHGHGTPTMGQQTVSPSNGIQNLQSFINGIPTMTNGTGPQIVNVSNDSVVIYGENNAIRVTAKPKGGKQRLPLTEEEQRTLASTRPVADKDIDLVAEHLGRKWRELGRKLKFSKGQLDAFEADYHGMRETIYQMLLRWKERESSTATVGRLAQELESLKKRSVVKKLTA